MSSVSVNPPVPPLSTPAIAPSPETKSATALLSQAASGFVGALKEITATAFALVILALSVLMLHSMFQQSADNWDKKKDILLYTLPLLSAVIGHYFGRVPAERRAEAAEKSGAEAAAVAGQAARVAGEAQRQHDERVQQIQYAHKRMAEAKASIDRIRNRSSAGPRPFRESGVASFSSPGVPSAIPPNQELAELESVSELLSDPWPS
jgi:hypothetical protein